MSVEKHHHRHHFHHQEEEGKPAVDAAVYSDTTYSSDGVGGYKETTDVFGAVAPLDTHDYKKEEKHHKHLEHLGELGAAAAGAYALDMERIRCTLHPEILFLISSS